MATQYEPSTGPNIILVDTKTWKPERQFAGPRIPTALSFLSDSRTLLVGNPGGELTIIDTNGSAPLRAIPATGYASAVAGSPDASLILTDKVVDTTLNQIALSPDGRYIAAATASDLVVD